jgi:hypothetical protein
MEKENYNSSGSISSDSELVVALVIFIEKIWKFREIKGKTQKWKQIKECENNHSACYLWLSCQYRSRDLGLFP